MTSERWAEVRALLEAAMLLPAEERVAYVRAHAPAQEVRDEAEQLLGYDRESSEIFAVEGWRISAEDAVTGGRLEGSLVGNYRLIEEIGRGGMGAVYLAERADGEYQQRVAVKVMQEGLFTEGLVKRFREERQILARLSHPGIARLLDGGITQDRRPYLVLEYVDGRPIDRYCAEEKLNTRAKLILFLKVAEAVQSAHQDLVLHLDLKPGNILVTKAGEPRLLDFGISRLLSEGENGMREAEATLRLLTPRYASPEQATGAPLGVASDVYSLATLLYRLLTGKLPYPIEDEAPLEAARILCEVPAAVPSSLAPPDVAAELRGDLDTILLQALRKEPSRRYRTVATFADDVDRYLHSRPVQAHADSVGYRVSKFLRRNRVAATVSAVALTVVVVSMVAMVRSAVIAERERATAERRLGDVRSLAHSYIFDLIPELEGIPGTLKVRSEVTKRALGYLEAMSKEQTSDPALERELASGYYTMGRLQGNSMSTSLGDRPGGWDLLNRSLAIQRRIVAKNPGDLQDRVRLMTSLKAVANMLVSQGDIVAGQALHREAWDVGQPILADGEKNPMLVDLANSAWYMSMSFCGDGEWNIADPAQGLEWARRSESILSRHAAANPAASQDPRFNNQLATAKAAEADALVLLGKPDEAAALYREYLPVFDREPLAQDAASLETRRYMHQKYARLLVLRGNLPEATRVSSILRPSERKERGEFGKDLWRALAIADSTGWAAIMDWRNGHAALSQAEMQECLETYRKFAKSEPDLMWPETALMSYLLDFAELPQIDPVQAQAMFKEAAAIASRYAASHPQVLSAPLTQARAHLGMKHIADAMKKPDDVRREAAAAREILQGVLAARPGLPVAEEMLADAGS